VFALSVERNLLVILVVRINTYEVLIDVTVRHVH